MEIDPTHTRAERIAFYTEVIGKAQAMGPEVLREVRRELCRSDVFYLLVHVLRRHDANHDWTFERCKEVQASPDGHLDLWAREHYKSTIITLAMTIQEVIRDPNITICIFSYTRPLAKKPLKQIMNEFEGNSDLKELFSDILWADPRKEAPRWSLDDGIVVRRTSNPKESTIEAWGMTEGLPTGSHFLLRVYDDVIDQRSVTNPDMIKGVIEQWELSLALGTRGGRARYVGTRYHSNDPYQEMMKRGSVKPRLYPATHDGTMSGQPVFMTVEELAQRRRDWGPYTFAAQMLQNPSADSTMGFQLGWVKYYDSIGEGTLNKYILCDPASAKKKESDYTVMWVIGLGADRKFYIIDCIRDRLNLTERGDALFQLHADHEPLGVGYEKYGMMCDVEYFQERMGRENYRFDITELGGPMAKVDRIRRLIPLFEQGRILLPHTLFKEDYEHRQVDLVSTFINEEYRSFPVPLHDDMLDALSRICDDDMSLTWPKGKNQRRLGGRDYGSRGRTLNARRSANNTWMVG